MKRISSISFCIMIILIVSTGCDSPFHAGRRPVNFPNTRWVSQDPDMFFVVGENISDNDLRPYADVTYAQIVIDGEKIELRVVFAQSGGQIYFDDPAGFDPDTGGQLPGVAIRDVHFFTGLGRFSPERLVVTITHNPRGFLDDSIEEIIFYREDIE